MRVFRALVAAAFLGATLALATACSSDSGDRGGLSDSSASGAAAEQGEPVHGDVMVAWKNLDPRNTPAAVGLVNESSEIGKKLKSGKAFSSTTRVLSDAQMGGLLDQLRKFGFFQYAVDGLSFDEASPGTGRKGILVVTQDGKTSGLMMTTNLGGSPIPKVYVDSKNFFFAVHNGVPGFDVKAGIGAPDERVFSAPPPRLKRP